ncbi:acetylcholine receptor subunit alpha-1-B-like [Dreissena polymorpha]|uniref:Uncharacterized protein n=1 Tax=Dreissena polymorpha TaxID=45954 RepID=A0A9D4LVG9_DREPO|nr:acetylcholine receptor subunit alpha-1-B-like [Dreissena polymorpha]KAH3864574.1 hypothetical protein DPMN_027593 [Dreissena polymorpha]
MELLIFLKVIILLSCLHKCTGNVGHDIWEHLFTNSSYNKYIRPVKNWRTPTEVGIGVSLIAIIEFDEVQQTLQLTSKVSIIWKDEFLVWDPDVFQNVSHIHVPQDFLWKPYIFLENSVTKQAELGTQSLEVLLDNTGTVTWSPTEVFQTTCAADVRKFPFDTQKCSMVFATHGYTEMEMKMKTLKDHIDFHGNGGTAGWTITETLVETEIADGGNIHTTCFMTLQRNPRYIVLNIFLPIVFLSFMNICVFILPVPSGEKRGFVITVFLALAVFLTIVSGNLPENSVNVSLLNIYVFKSTLLSVIIGIVTIVQIRIYHRDSNLPVPPWLRFIAKKCTSNPRSNDVEFETSVEQGERSGSSTNGRRAWCENLKEGDVTWPRTACRRIRQHFLCCFLAY